MFGLGKKHEAPVPLPADLPNLHREDAAAALVALQGEMDAERCDIYRAAGSRRWNVWIPTRLAPSTGGRRETLEEWAQRWVETRWAREQLIANGYGYDKTTGLLMRLPDGGDAA